jgi:hypothetical protein
MDGRTRAAKREADAALSLAWHIEAFARQKKLKPLNQLLSIKPKAQTPADMLDALRQFQARGVPMNFKQIN